MRASLAALAFAAAAGPIAAHAQELEPRAYSSAPVGTNFLVGSFTHFSGPVLLDPALTGIDINAHINAYTLAYARFSQLFGRSANFSAGVPYIQGDLHGRVMDAAADVHRAGWGDMRLRGGINLIGNPPVGPADFAKQPDVLSLGTSLTVIAPTGQYENTRFINIGSNRWSFKPDVGLSYPMGNWFSEAAFGIWYFGDNNDYLGGQRRSQDPLHVFQLHAGYNFRPGLWVAVDYGYYSGGRTAVNGDVNDDAQRNSRVGAVLSVPIDKGWSGKLSYSKGTAVRVGGDYSIYNVALQYRWFD
jgi:hypothetical protein